MGSKKFSEALGAYIVTIVLVVLAIYYSWIGFEFSSVGSGLAGGLGTGDSDIFIVGQLAGLRGLILIMFAFLVWEFHIRKK